MGCLPLPASAAWPPRGAQPTRLQPAADQPSNAVTSRGCLLLLRQWREPRRLRLPIVPIDLNACVGAGHQGGRTRFTQGLGARGRPYA